MKANIFFLKSVFLQMIGKLCYFVKTNINCISYAIILFWVILIAAYKIEVQVVIPITCVILLLCEYIRILGHEINKQPDNCPVNKEKFVNETEEGLLYINYKDYEKAVQYLYEVERYFDISGKKFVKKREV